MELNDSDQKAAPKTNLIDYFPIYLHFPAEIIEKSELI
jgi:hypothetical protein